MNTTCSCGSGRRRTRGAKTTLLARFIERLGLAAVAKTGIQTIAVQEMTAGDVELPFLSQQILEEPQVHFVWLDMDPADVTLRNRRGADHCSLELRQCAWAGPRDDPCSQSETREALWERCWTQLLQENREQRELGLKWRFKWILCNRRWRKLRERSQLRTRPCPKHDTCLFADAEVLVEALKIPTLPHGLDPRTRDELTRMTEALNKMKAQQQPQQPEQAQIPGQPLTPTATQGTEPFKELPVTQEVDLTQARRQAEDSTSGQDQETDQRRSKKLKSPTTGLPSQRRRRAVDWNGRRSEEQIHPGSQ